MQSRAGTQKLILVGVDQSDLRAWSNVLVGLQASKLKRLNVPKQKLANLVFLKSFSCNADFSLNSYIYIISHIISSFFKTLLHLERPNSVKFGHSKC